MSPSTTRSCGCSTGSASPRSARTSSQPGSPEQLAQALPQLDEHAVKAAGDTFDELTAFGEQIERRTAAAESLANVAAAYARYARAVVGRRGRDVLAAVKHERQLLAALRDRTARRDELGERRQVTETQLTSQRDGHEQARARIAELEGSPEARDQRRLGELAELARQRGDLAATAEARAQRHEERHRADREVHLESGGTLTAAIGDLVETARALATAQDGCGVGATVPVPPVLEPARFDDVESASRVADAMHMLGETLDHVGTGVTRRQAVVHVVRDALSRLADAVRKAAEADDRADAAERAWEGARDRRTTAEEVVSHHDSDLCAQLREWVADPLAPAGLELPGQLTPGSVSALEPTAKTAAEPQLRGWRDEAGRQTATADEARRRIAEIEEDRARVEAEPAPAPPVPSLERSPRSEGAGLWRLVDFADHIEPEARAGLEAALQASGLLDAWVRPDGRLLDDGDRDVVLAPGALADGATLAVLLRPDLPAGSDVTAEQVSGVLARVAVRPNADRSELDAAVGTDGSFRLAALAGRASKPQAQYVGATARADERRRRLDELDRARAEQQSTLADAERELARIEVAVADLETWLARRPPAGDLVAAWAVLEERREVEATAEASNSAAQLVAHDQRQVAAAVRGDVERLAAEHALPDTPEPLSALEERLRQLERDLSDAVAGVRARGREMAGWLQAAGRLTDDAAAVDVDRAEADRLAAQSRRAEAQLHELRASVGDTVAELESRLERWRTDARRTRQAADDLEQQLNVLMHDAGVADTELGQAQSDLTRHRADRADLLADFARLADVPGLLVAAFDDTDLTRVDAAAVLAAAESPVDEPLPRQVTLVAADCATRADGSDSGDGDVNVVWRAYHEATSGPAADHDVTVLTFGDLAAVTGRDDAGETPISTLATRVAAAVAADRELLTQREREQFEQHVLGELGDAIRRCRLEADELVEAMNRLLGGVTTSQGIRVRLHWQLRDDVPAEAREAMRLLGQPVGALLPDERAHLRDALHRLIETSRGERPELSYGEHLAAALDYRSWFGFRIRYTRPEADGAWSDLHRRSPLSQGEQKVLCYLPLFAAAAAHFTSLAGAAPHAPRLVLLDDAFPKIDVRTHPLLFGLLVDLDLDFVITSERLWGDHDTIPSLAIYEALRDPTQRGIAQFEYRWDGRALRSIG